MQTQNMSADQIVKTKFHFIFCLALEDWAKEFKTYFYKNGFNSTEANYVERMVDTYGAEYIFNYIK
jgi:hypothetical protein